MGKLILKTHRPLTDVSEDFADSLSCRTLNHPTKIRFVRVVYEYEIAVETLPNLALLDKIHDTIRAAGDNPSNVIRDVEVP